MPRNLPRPPFLLVPLAMAVAISCDRSATSPFDAPAVAFAQGDGGVWTVNTLADPGDGVCDDAHCTLREAIAAAASGHSIVFASGLSGQIDLGARLRIEDKSLMIDGDARIAIDGQRNHRVLEIVTGLGARPNVTLEALTIQNGVDVDYGAGIYADGVNLVLDEVTITNNETLLDGGGLALHGADAIVRNGMISSNAASNIGGGIFVDAQSSLRLIESTVRDNVVNNGIGGGIANRTSRTTIERSLLLGNRTGANGRGGALALLTGDVTIENSTVSANLAEQMAAGLLNGGFDGSPAGGNLVVRSSTITRNNSPSGSGIMHGGSGGNRTTVSNSIVAGNLNGDCSSPSGGFQSVGYNLGSTSGGCQGDFNQTGDVLVHPALIFTDVLEQELADNGGATATHALIVRGRAVDAGYCPGTVADQRNFARPVDDPSLANARDGCDIGAYELQGPVVPVADLMISQTVNKTSVKQGEQLTYFIRVQNLGPQAAPNVVVTDLLSSGVTFVEVRQNKGTVTAPPRGETGTVTWSIGEMANQENQVAELVVTVLVRGKTTITNTASVTGDVSDPNTANNSAAITVSVAAGTTGGKK